MKFQEKKIYKKNLSNELKIYVSEKKFFYERNFFFLLENFFLVLGKLFFWISNDLTANTIKRRYASAKA